MFLNNSWYVAALASKVDRNLLASRLLGQQIVLYRKTSGEVVALRDRCAHRHAPLSLGTLQGDEIQCRYHGFRFDCSGACTRIPGESSVPAAIKVDRFPVLERFGLVWVWMGDPASADEGRVPVWSWYDRPDFQRYFKDFVIEAPFLSIVDNLMDLTHVHFVHRILGAENLIHESEPMKTWEDGDQVLFTRDLRKDKNSDAYMEIGGRYIPASVVFTTSMPKKDGSAEVQPGPVSQVMHCLTPQDENSTRYFAVKCWNLMTQPHEIAAVQHQVDVTVAEDKEIIEAQQQIKRASPPGTRETLVRADRAAVMARRAHERLLKNERETKASASVA